MSLDLTALSDALASLEAAKGIVDDQTWFNQQSMPVRQTLVAGVIQNVEFVYELSIKMLRRRIELDAASPTEADFADFRQLLRLGAERGLIADVEAWFGHRKMRNITSHSYNQEKALAVLGGTDQFIVDAKDLLARLKARNV